MLSAVVPRAGFRESKHKLSKPAGSEPSESVRRSCSCIVTAHPRTSTPDACPRCSSPSQASILANSSITVSCDDSGDSDVGDRLSRVSVKSDRPPVSPAVSSSRARKISVLPSKPFRPRSVTDPTSYAPELPKETHAPLLPLSPGSPGLHTSLLSAQIEEISSPITKDGDSRAEKLDVVLDVQAEPMKVLRPQLPQPAVWSVLQRGSLVIHFLALVLFIHLVVTYLPPIIDAVSSIRSTLARLDLYIDAVDSLVGHDTSTEIGRAQWMHELHDPASRLRATLHALLSSRLPPDAS
jgi:hypothetical protein